MNVEFRRADLRPLDLFGQARSLMEPDYWLFFGITAVGMILGSLVPLGILLGPLMCGIYLAYKAKSRGEQVEFAMLWKGFEVFKESLIATLIVVGISLVFIVPATVLYMVGVFRTMEGEEPEAMFAIMGVFYAFVFAISLVLGALFMFIYPLIADRRVKGTEAISLSFKACLANLWGVVKLTLFNGLLGLCGVVCCYVGVLFVIPITIGMTWLAYRQVFPAQDTVLPT